MDQSFQDFSGISVSICDDFLRLGVKMGTICDFLTVTSLNEAKMKWYIRQGNDELVYLLDRAKMNLCIRQFIRAAAREYYILNDPGLLSLYQLFYSRF